MPQGYCIECRAHVTVRDGACLLGHSIDPSTIVAGSGRHRAARARRLSHQPIASRGAIGVDVVRIEPDIQHLEPPPSIPEPELPPPVEHHDERQAERTERALPESDPGPWQRPLLGRRRLPMLEMLGFSDPDSEASIVKAPAPVDGSPRPAKPAPNGRSSLANRASAEPTLTPGPTLADVKTDRQPVENTGVLVARLWDATKEHPGLGEDWKPVAAIEAPRRSFRWSYLSAATAIVVAIAFLAVAAYRWPINQAEEIRADLTTGAGTLEQATIELPISATVILDGESTTEELADAAIPLMAFGEAANRAYGSATAEVRSLPLVSSEPLDALTPIQTELRRAADAGLVIHDQLGDILDYRILVEGAFVLPEVLPVTGSDERISEVGTALSDTIASTTEVVLRLPTNEFLSSHRLGIEAALSDLTLQVADYLSALRDGNQVSASRLATEIRITARAAQASLDGPLAELQTWLSASMKDLTRRLDTTKSLLAAG